MTPIIRCAANVTIAPGAHRIARVITVLLCLLIITAERDGYIKFATVVARTVLTTS
jgi:hypothetical protein